MVTFKKLFLCIFLLAVVTAFQLAAMKPENPEAFVVDFIERHFELRNNIAVRESFILFINTWNDIYDKADPNCLQNYALTIQGYSAFSTSRDALKNRIEGYEKEISKFLTPKHKEEGDKVLAKKRVIHAHLINALEQEHEKQMNGCSIV